MTSEVKLFFEIDGIAEDATPVKHYHIDEMNLGTFPVEFQSGISETVDPETRELSVQRWTDKKKTTPV